MTGSLEGRLHLGLSLSLAVLIAAALGLGHSALHRATDAYVISRLQHDAEALLVALGAPDGLDPDSDGMAPIYRQPYSGHYYKVIAGDGAELRSRSLWDEDLEVEPLPPGEVRLHHVPGPAGQPLLVRSAGYRVDDRPLTLAVAEDLTPLTEVLRGFERLFVLLAALGLAAIVLVQRVIVHRTFGRLAPVYRDIEGLERGTTGRLTEAVPTEILPLVRKLNALIGVYDERLTRSRNAAGNLAHALKGPLNLMVQQLERPDAALTGEVRRACAEQVERVRQLVERELKRARIAGGARPGSIFDPAAELPALHRLLLGMYADKALRLDCDNRLPGPVPADREDMLELAGTLLDNACKWARERVACTLEPDGPGLRFAVEDDGPGCDDAALADLVGRGTRLDERVEGHGLGLSIAREIVELYGGTLTLGRSPSLGGFRAEVRLPLSALPGARYSPASA